MKKSLIIGIIFLIISLGLVIYSEFINSPVNMYSLTNTASKKENKKAYIDSTFVAGTITGSNGKSYYVMFGNGVQYIVYMENSEANKIMKYLLDNPEDSYQIKGITKLIPATLEENGKKFVKEWLDNNHTHNEEVNHSHDISTEEFYQYFGYVYLDNTVYENNINKLIIYITGIIGILFIVFYVNRKYHLL